VTAASVKRFVRRYETVCLVLAVGVVAGIVAVLIVSKVFKG
jgi:hypothetical protein